MKEPGPMLKLSLPAVLFVLLLTGCNLAPGYQLPVVATAPQFKEAAPWVAAHPADQLPRGPWWTIYSDPGLDKLESELDANNQDLAAAAAHYDEAVAFENQAQAGLFPTLGGGGNTSNNRQSDTRPLRGTNQPDVYGSDTAGLSADYEIDFWGKVRNEVAAAHSEALASADDLATAKLSLETRLAEDYVSLLGEDREIQLLTDTVDAYQKALEMTHTLHAGGAVSGLDESRASSQLDTAVAQVFDFQARRVLLEHSIAVLVGESPSSFSLAPDAHLVAVPAVPVALPSALLQRRPDIAAAERRTEAANSRIGVARAAFYPNIDLSASIGLQSTGYDSWLTAPSTFWSVGPNLAQLLFDGGLNDARLAQAEARLKEAGAVYRSTVLRAFQQVEDNLAVLALFRKEREAETRAVKTAQETLDLSLSFYKNGGVGYLDVITAQTDLLTLQRRELDLETEELEASLGLVEALGGGWNNP
jgi:NodT family efflux transporter outer membrane factor (OMF) lipoprotein